MGQSEWFCADQRGRFNWDFLEHKDRPLEEINMSYTLINYTGLCNLGNELLLIFDLFFSFLKSSFAVNCFFSFGHMWY